MLRIAVRTLRSSRLDLDEAVVDGRAASASVRPTAAAKRMCGRSHRKSEGSRCNEGRPARPPLFRGLRSRRAEGVAARKPAKFESEVPPAARNRPKLKLRDRKWPNLEPQLRRALSQDAYRS